MRLKAPPPRLAGRDTLLGLLHDRLSSAASLPCTIVLHGLGGVGKTSLVRQYGRRYGQEYDLIWEIAAEDPATLSTGLVALASELGVRDLVDSTDAATQVHGALAVRPGRWLLILDNVRDPRSIGSVLPPEGRGHVLITTRHAHWPAGQAVEVPVLDRQAAADFLIQATGDADPVAAATLAEELGTLPLALEQAAAYSRATGRTLGRYLSRLRERRMDMLGRGRPWGYDATVSRTWQIALNQLAADSPAAVAMLRLLSNYAPDAVPYDLLLPSAAAPGDAAILLGELIRDDIAVDDAVSALRDYSLVTLPAAGTVSIHRLIQSVVRAQIPESRRAAWKQAAASLLTGALPGSPAEPGTWPRYAALFPHARAVTTATSAVMKEFGTYLEASADYPTALILHRERHAALRARSGPDHPDVLESADDLAWMLGRLGDTAAARDATRKVLDDRIRVLGRTHPDTLATWDRLAFWAGKAGDAAAARDLCAELLPIRREVSGAAHPDTLWVLSNLAWWIGVAGDPATARDMYDGLISAARDAFPFGSHGLAVMLGNRAYWVAQAGDPARARDLAAEALRAHSRASGPEHPETLLVHSNLAQWTGDAGDPATAVRLLEEILAIRERVTDPEDPAFHTDRTRLAHWRARTGARG